jgi:hypothetical protein
MRLSDPSTSPLPPAVVPDLILIPEPLKSIAIESLGPDSPISQKKYSATKLRSLLRHARIQRLGDLHGKRLSDFEQYRSCGRHTIAALRDMLLTAINPGVKPNPRSLPIPMWACKPPKTKDEFSDLPISTQRRYRLRMLRDKRCTRCGEPVAQGSLCPKHLDYIRERMRKTLGLKRRYKNSLSYKLEQGTS